MTLLRGPDGERVSKTVSRPGQAAATTLYFGPDLEVGPDGVMTKRVAPDVKRVGQGTSAQPQLLHRDHLSSVRLVTGGVGQEVGRTLYRPSGEVLSRTGDLREELGFIGERHDREMGGLVDLHARTYDPNTFRFLQADQLDPWLPGVGLNRYAYSPNDPVNNADPNGQAVIDAIAAGALIGGIVGVTIEAVAQVSKQQGIDAFGLATAFGTGAASGAFAAASPSTAVAAIGSGVLGAAQAYYGAAVKNPDGYVTLKDTPAIAAGFVGGVVAGKLGRSAALGSGVNAATAATAASAASLAKNAASGVAKSGATDTAKASAGKAATTFGKAAPDLGKAAAPAGKELTGGSVGKMTEEALGQGLGRGVTSSTDRDRGATSTGDPARSGPGEPAKDAPSEPEDDRDGGL